MELRASSLPASEAGRWSCGDFSGVLARQLGRQRPRSSEYAPRAGGGREAVFDGGEHDVVALEQRHARVHVEVDEFGVHFITAQDTLVVVRAELVGRGHAQGACTCALLVTASAANSRSWANGLAISR